MRVFHFVDAVFQNKSVTDTTTIYFLLGSEVVDWIMKDRNLTMRRQAESVAEALRRQGVIRHVNKTQKNVAFADNEHTYYKFRKQKSRSSVKM